MFASVAVINETHFKQKHTDSAVGIDGRTVVTGPAGVAEGLLYT